MSQSDTPALDWFGALIDWYEEGRDGFRGKQEWLIKLSGRLSRADIERKTVASIVTMHFLTRCSSEETFRENIKLRIKESQEGYLFAAMKNAIHEAVMESSNGTQKAFYRGQEAIMKGISRAIERGDFKGLTHGTMPRTRVIIHADGNRDSALATSGEILRAASEACDYQKKSWAPFAVETMRLLGKPVVVEQLVDILFQVSPVVQEIYSDADIWDCQVQEEDPYGDYGVEEEMMAEAERVKQGLTPRELDVTRRKLGEPDKYDRIIAEEMGLSPSTISRAIKSAGKKIESTCYGKDWWRANEHKEKFLEILRDTIT